MLGLRFIHVFTMNWTSFKTLCGVNRERDLEVESPNPPQSFPESFVTVKAHHDCSIAVLSLLPAKFVPTYVHVTASNPELKAEPTVDPNHIFFIPTTHTGEKSYVHNKIKGSIPASSYYSVLCPSEVHPNYSILAL